MSDETVMMPARTHDAADCADCPEYRFLRAELSEARAAQSVRTPDPQCAECSRLRIEAGRMDARLAAAREAIRVLLGDAGLDGLGDLTTVDGRSVVDIVRRGLGWAP